MALSHFVLFTSLCAAVAVHLTFEPPTLLASGLGEYADVGYALGVGDAATPPLLFLEGSGFTTSADGGRSWAVIRNGSCAHTLPSGGVNGVPVRVSKTALRGFGFLRNASSSGTAFTSDSATTFSLTDGSLECTSTKVRTSFSGLPQPSHCVEAGAFGCPFRLTGGDLATLSDGTLFYSAMVFWGNPDARHVVPSSIVAFKSTDGFAWEYTGTIAGTADYPASQEGPNENALIALSDGTTLACIFRLDAGDGPATHPFVHYALSTSSDRGRTWSHGVMLPTAGSARPRLRHLGADGAGGIPDPAAPVLLTGGRLRDAALSSDGWDAKVWWSVDSTALAPDAWSLPVSLSFWHNTLTPNSSWAFTPAVNASTAPRQMTAYTSIIPLDAGPAPGTRSRRVGVTYNRHIGAEELFFMMPLVVEW